MIFREFVEQYNEALASKDKEQQERLLAKFEKSLDDLLEMSLMPRPSDYFLCLTALPVLTERFALKIIKVNTKLLGEKEVPGSGIYQVMNRCIMKNWLQYNLGNKEVYDAFMAFALKVSENKDMHGLILEWWGQSNAFSGEPFPNHWKVHRAISEHLKELYGNGQIEFDQEDSWERIIYNVYIADAEECIGKHIARMNNA